jgi:predicted membrane protein
MPAISLFGLVLLAVQVSIGYYTHQSLSSVSRATKLAAAVLTTSLGFVVLFSYGVAVTLLLDVVLLLALTGIRGNSGQYPRSS